MNLRILKKLSKRAAPMLPMLGDHREQFRSERGDNYLATTIHERKHWERGRSVRGDPLPGGEGIKRPARDGRGGFVYMRPPHHPRKGTMMVGATSGYYEPEWAEETAWEALRTIVQDHFTDWSEEGPTALREFRTPAAVLKGAADILELTREMNDAD